MNQGRNTILLIGVIVLFFYLWIMSQSKTRGMATGKAAGSLRLSGGFCKLAQALRIGRTSGPAPKGGGGSKSGGGASGGGSGAGTAGGRKMCGKTPGSAFCGCASCSAYAGKDANGNEIYQKDDGSLVYSDGSAASQGDIVCNEGACVGTVCNPQCQQTAQPCCNAGACGGCIATGCFCVGCCGCAGGGCAGSACFSC